jgi:hypothetical protein
MQRAVKCLRSVMSDGFQGWSGVALLHKTSVSALCEFAPADDQLHDEFMWAARAASSPYDFRLSQDASQRAARKRAVPSAGDRERAG